MKFTEEKLEKAFIELVAKEGFNHHFGVAITRSPEEVLKNCGALGPPARGHSTLCRTRWQRFTLPGHRLLVFPQGALSFVLDPSDEHYTQPLEIGEFARPAAPRRASPYRARQPHRILGCGVSDGR